MVLTNEEWSELQQLKEQELAVWSQIHKWTEHKSSKDRCYSQCYSEGGSS